MLIVSTVQVLPLSEVVRPEDVASLRERVSPNPESATSKTRVVDRYSMDGDRSASMNGACGWRGSGGGRGLGR